MTDPVDVLARTGYGEARGEGSGGIHAVVNVVMNRAAKAQAYVATHGGAAHPLFGDGTPASACLVQHHGVFQFSCCSAASFNAANLSAMTAATPDDPVFASCLDIAQDALNGDLPDVTNGATYYFDRRMNPPPAWALAKTPCAEIGHHVFFNNIS